MNKLILGTIILIIAISACRSDKVQLATQNDIQLENAIKKFSPNGELDHFILPQSNDYNSIPSSPENPITPVKVALGKKTPKQEDHKIAPLIKGGVKVQFIKSPTGMFGLGYNVDDEASFDKKQADILIEAGYAKKV